MHWVQEDFTSCMVFDVKNVNEKPRAKKVVERQFMCHKQSCFCGEQAGIIQASLDGDGVIAEVMSKEYLH